MLNPTACLSLTDPYSAGHGGYRDPHNTVKIVHNKFNNQHGLVGAHLQSQHWNVKAGGPGVQSHPQLLSKFEVALGYITPCSQKTK